MRDRTKQITIDLTKHPKALEVYTAIPNNKTAWVAEAIEEKHNKESNPFTPEQIEAIDQRFEELFNVIKAWVDNYYTKKDL